MSDPIPHPAKYSSALYPVILRLLANRGIRTVLDPFAGVGGIHELYPEYETFGVELEAEWALQHPRTICGNATRLSTLFPGKLFDAIVTSPSYGNRMADTYAGQPTDSPRTRHTYRVYLGRPLSEHSGAALQWGAAYQMLHLAAWNACKVVLKPGGYFLLNIKDHVRNGKIIPVSQWHVDALHGIGFETVTSREVPVPSQRHGENGEARLETEHLVLLQLGVNN